MLLMQKKQNKVIFNNLPFKTALRRRRPEPDQKVKESNTVDCMQILQITGTIT